MVDIADRYGRFDSVSSTQPLPVIAPPVDAPMASASAWGFGGRAILLLANLAATPVLIRLLGPASYGLLALLVLATAWASNADLGMGTASTKFGAGYFASGDAQGESTVVWTALGLVALTTGCVATGLALAAHSVLTQLLHDQSGLITAGTVALRIGCAVFVLQSVAAIVNTPQVVRLEWRQWTILTTAVNLAGTIGTPVALALFGGGITTVAVVSLVASVLMVAGNLLLAVRLQPALLHPRFDRAVLRKLLTFGGALTVAGLAVIPLTTAERFFLAHNHSTTDVAYFAVAVNLATTIQVLPEQLTAPFLPALTRLHEAGQRQELRDLYHKSLSGLFLLVTPLTVLLAFVARPFLSLWAGPQYGAHSTVPFLIVIAGVWIDCLAFLPVSYLLSAGRTKTIAYIKLGELVPYLIAAWILTDRFGVIGAAVAWSVGCVLDSVLLFAAARQAETLPWLPWSDRRLRSLAAPVALGAVAALLAHVSSGLAVRLGCTTALTLIYGAAVWYLVLSGRERRGLRVLAGQILRRKSAASPRKDEAPPRESARHAGVRRTRAPWRTRTARHART